MPRSPDNTESRPGVRLVTVDGSHAGQRLDNFLSSLLKGVPKAAVYRLIRTGQVRVNGHRAKPSGRVEEGDEVRIPPARIRTAETAEVSAAVREQVRRTVLYEDASLLVLDKPAGMAVHAGSGLPWGLIDALRQDRPDEFLELVHRLDRETSGCLVVARSRSALNHLAEQFREGRVSKSYLCLLEGQLPQDLVEVDAALQKSDAEPRGPVEVQEGGKPARTRFRLLQRYRDCCYVEAELFTGRTHQIRAHARHLGMPLVGDDKYGSRDKRQVWRSRGLKRLFLHAHRLALVTPDGQRQEFSSPLPAELRGLLDHLDS